MDIQKQIEFEKFHARECNCDYDELKRRLDHQEKVMGHRYIPSSPRHEAWLVWNAAWKAKAQAVPEGFNFGLAHDTKINDPKELLFRCLRKMKYANRFRSIPNWVHVRDLCELGSGTATMLCRFFGVDPNGIKFEVIEAQEPTHD